LAGCQIHYPAALSLPPLDRTEVENKAQKLMGWDTDRKITHQLPSQAKQTRLGKN